MQLIYIPKICLKLILDFDDHVSLAVLGFVGGKNIVIPSERAAVPEAAGICTRAGLELISLDSITQLNSVQDFLLDIGTFFH